MKLLFAKIICSIINVVFLMYIYVAITQSITLITNVMNIYTDIMEKYKFQLAFENIFESSIFIVNTCPND